MASRISVADYDTDEEKEGHLFLLAEDEHSICTDEDPMVTQIGPNGTRGLFAMRLGLALGLLSMAAMCFRGSPISTRHVVAETTRSSQEPLFQNAVLESKYLARSFKARESKIKSWKMNGFWCHEGAMPLFEKAASVAGLPSPVRLLSADITPGKELLVGSLVGFDILSFQGCDNYEQLRQIRVPTDADFVTLAVGLSPCLAYRRSKFDLLGTGVNYIGVDNTSKSAAQWVRLKATDSDRILLFTNVHGPRLANSGGLCGGSAFAYELAMMIKDVAVPGDAIVVAGAFNSNVDSQAVVALTKSFENSISSTEHFDKLSYQHVFSNRGLACTNAVKRNTSSSVAITIDLGGKCTADETGLGRHEGPMKVTKVANSHMIWQHWNQEADNHSSKPRGPKLAIFDMRSWSCSGKCSGGGCCEEGDCSWECHKDLNYSHACASYLWSQEDFSCTLFAQAGTHPDPVVVRLRAPLQTFYAYRATSGRDYDVGSVNMANLAGEIYYIHHEVVSLLDHRHHHISRIQRYKVTFQPTLEVYNSGPHHPMWLEFVACDWGACPLNHSVWAKYGYNPGCQAVGDDGLFGYKHGLWYSFPAECPSKHFGEKDDSCRTKEPGGFCASPTGEKDCTWHMEPAGEVMLNELAGIDNYTDFMNKKGREYEFHSDEGTHIHFWDKRKDPERCAERVRHAEDLFAKKYPDSPRYPDPKCRWAGH